MPKEEIWFPDDVFVPADVASVSEQVRLSPEYAAYSLILDEDEAYAWAELEIVGRWQTERAAALEAMPYSDYLWTSEWGDKRAAALVRDRWRCRVCNSGDRLCVHHRSYARRGRERIDDLTVLCRGCHSLFHDGAACP